MQQYHRQLTATIRQLTGKRYDRLEAALPNMDREALLDLLRLLGDVREGENQRCRGQARRMGLPGVIR